MRSESFFVAALLATSVAACGIDEEQFPGDGPAPTFENVVDVLKPKCTFSQCHNNPTVAANLDLTPQLACDTLVNQSSCLFPERKRVVPGDPSASFFLHKLTGEGLSDTPTGDCGFGSQTRTNALMPLGGSELTEDELKVVRGWISAGASCEPTGSGSQGPQLTALTASKSAPLAGEMFMVTLELDRPAPANGQAVTVDVDQMGLLLAPSKVVVGEGTMSVKFNAYPQRPASRFTLRARSGNSTKEIVLRIGGVEIAEVLADPVGSNDGLQWVKIRNTSPFAINLNNYRLRVGVDNYSLISVDLGGMLGPNNCALIGGPLKSSANGDPSSYWQEVDFEPNLPSGAGNATGFALFDRVNPPVGGVPTPVDTMIVGSSNTAIVDPDGTLPSPGCSTPVTGRSAQRTGTDTCAQAIMQPNVCN
jgi:hypothetical protein